MKHNKKDVIVIKDSTPTLIIILLASTLLLGGILYFTYFQKNESVIVGTPPTEVASEFQLTVINAKGEPLEGATITARFGDNEQKTYTSSKDGKTTIVGKKGNQFDFEIRHKGYDPEELSMYCCSNEIVSLQQTITQETLFRMHGSNTVGAKLAPALAKGYLEKLGAANVQVLPTERENEVEITGIKDNTIKIIEIAAHGSSTGFKSLAANNCDIGMASRKIKDKEANMLEFLGNMTSTASEHVLALDGIAVIVNQANPLNELSIDQVAAIFNGEVNNWSSLGTLKGKINVYARDDKSGTFDTFNSLVLRKKPLVADAARFESNAKLSDQVASDKFGIGFTSLPNIRNAKALSISDGAAAILPNFFTVATEDYGLSRRLYLYTPPNPANQHTKDFIRFALDSSGQKIVEANSLVDLNIRTFISRIDSDQQAIDQDIFSSYLQAVRDAKRLSLNFRFQKDGFKLDNRAYRDLDRMVNFLKDYVNQDTKILLIGFTDSLGDYTYNRDLAFKRAQTVAKEFRARGISFVDTLSAAEEVPVASNETEAGQQKNRRVEVWLKTTSTEQVSVN